MPRVLHIGNRNHSSNQGGRPPRFSRGESFRNDLRNALSGAGIGPLGLNPPVPDNPVPFKDVAPPAPEPPPAPALVSEFTVRDPQKDFLSLLPPTEQEQITGALTGEAVPNPIAVDSPVLLAGGEFDRTSPLGAFLHNLTLMQGELALPDEILFEVLGNRIGLADPFSGGGIPAAAEAFLTQELPLFDNPVAGLELILRGIRNDAISLLQQANTPSLEQAAGGGIADIELLLQQLFGNESPLQVPGPPPVLTAEQLLPNFQPFLVGL